MSFPLDLLLASEAIFEEKLKAHAASCQGNFHGCIWPCHINPSTAYQCQSYWRDRDSLRPASRLAGCLKECSSSLAAGCMNQHDLCLLDHLMHQAGLQHSYTKNNCRQVTHKLQKTPTSCYIPQHGNLTLTIVSASIIDISMSAPEEWPGNAPSAVIPPHICASCCMGISIKHAIQACYSKACASKGDSCCATLTCSAPNEYNDWAGCRQLATFCLVSLIGLRSLGPC